MWNRTHGEGKDEGRMMNDETAVAAKPSHSSLDLLCNSYASGNGGILKFAQVVWKASRRFHRPAASRLKRSSQRALWWR